MAFYSSSIRTEEVHASGIRVFKQVPQQQQQHDHDSKPESWLVLHVATVRFVNQVGGTIGSTTTFNKKPFPFDLQTLSSPLSLKLFVNSIAQETGLFSDGNCRLLAKEISDGLFTRFEFSKDAIYGTTTSLAILVQISRAEVLEELDVTNSEAPAPTGWVAHNVAGRDEIPYHTDEDQENDHAGRSELTSSADDDEQEHHAVATTTALNKTSAGDEEQVIHVIAAPTSPREEQEIHVHDASANEEEGRDDDEIIYYDSVGEEGRDYDIYSSGEEEEGGDEIESLDSFLYASDEGFFDNHGEDDDDDLIGDGPEGYEEVVAFELILGDDCRNNSESNDQCSICLVGYSSCGIEVVKTNCGHMFHKHCITKWLARHLTCPFCRSDCIALV